MNKLSVSNGVYQRRRKCQCLRVCNIQLDDLIIALVANIDITAAIHSQAAGIAYAIHVSVRNHALRVDPARERLHQYTTMPVIEDVNVPIGIHRHI